MNTTMQTTNNGSATTVVQEPIPQADNNDFDNFWGVVAQERHPERIKSVGITVVCACGGKASISNENHQSVEMTEFLGITKSCGNSNKLSDINDTPLKVVSSNGYLNVLPHE